MSMTGDYSNRSDLRNPATRRVAFTGQTYGEGAAQQRSQALVAPGSSPQEVQAQQMAGRVRPGAKVFSRPSERPQEPLTAGADFGAGPNSLQAGIRPRIIQFDPVMERLKALYRLYPNEGLRMLIQTHDRTPI